MRLISFDRNGTLKNKKTEKWIVKTIKCIHPEPGLLILLKVSSESWVNKFIPSGIRPPDNNFVTPSHTCGEQFAHRRFFYFWLLCPRFKRVSFFQRIPAADCRRQTAHSLLWVRFVFVPALKTPIFTVLFS
ncbi:MAG: hypothetical protein ACLTEF_14215 [[Clostridium] leptum]